MGALKDLYRKMGGPKEIVLSRQSKGTNPFPPRMQRIYEHDHTMPNPYGQNIGSHLCFAILLRTSISPLTSFPLKGLYHFHS
jgi:hypothetical protein